MLRIRLARAGAKKRPFYHIVVADQRRPLGGRYIERIGFYNPIAAGKEVRLKIDQELLNQWKEKGAQPTERVLELLQNIAPIEKSAAA